MGCIFCDRENKCHLFKHIVERLAVGTNMDESILQRQNSIGITYVVGEIIEQHYKTIIQRTLGVPVEEVEGIDDRGPTRFLFEVSTKERYEDICSSSQGETYL